MELIFPGKKILDRYINKLKKKKKKVGNKIAAYMVGQHCWQQIIALDTF